MKSRTAITAMSICAGVILAGLVTVRSGQSASPTNFATTWQHLALTQEIGKEDADQSTAQQINRLGQEGWELIDVENFAVDGTTRRTVYYFKKQR